MIGTRLRVLGHSFAKLSHMQHASLQRIDHDALKPNFIKKKLFSFKNKKYLTSELVASGEHMYTICAEFPDFDKFIEHFNLEDSFQSWFSITTLHIWLCLVRLRKEGEDGHEIKKRFLKVFIDDMNARMRSFGVTKDRSNQVIKLRDQLLGSVMAYDEGFLSHSDAILASSLWRNLFISSDSTTPIELESSVHYVRKQLAHLDQQPSERVVRFGIVTFLPIIGEELDHVNAVRRLTYCLNWPEETEI